MAKDVILLGEVAARGATMMEIRCGRYDRAGRLSVASRIEHRLVSPLSCDVASISGMAHRQRR